LVIHLICAFEFSFKYKNINSLRVIPAGGLSVVKIVFFCQAFVIVSKIQMDNSSFKGSPLQEFAPATTWIPSTIPMENPPWNSHGCRSKLLQRLRVLKHGISIYYGKSIVMHKW